MELIMFVKEKKLISVHGLNNSHVDVHLCSRDLEDTMSEMERHGELYNYCVLHVSLLEGEDDFKLGQQYKITIQPFKERR